jgi:SAM-dependent methyltransferase
MLVSCRSMAEYRGMFALTDGDLAGRVLDCSGGAAGFTAEALALGCAATACDPLYATATREALAARAPAETARANAYVRAHPDEYVWTFFRDADHHQRLDASALRFAADLRAGPQRYVPAALPALPLAAATFDLALCSHLLFSYADRLDEAFHLAALRELARVAREVRVFPLVAMGSAAELDLHDLRGALTADGIGTEIRRVGYEFQRGGDAMLICLR